MAETATVAAVAFFFLERLGLDEPDPMRSAPAALRVLAEVLALGAAGAAGGVSAAAVAFLRSLSWPSLMVVALLLRVTGRSWWRGSAGEVLIEYTHDMYGGGDNAIELSNHPTGVGGTA